MLTTSPLRHNNITWRNNGECEEVLQARNKLNERATTSKKQEIYNYIWGKLAESYCKPKQKRTCLDKSHYYKPNGL